MVNGSTISNQFLANLPIFKGENYDKWCGRMKVIFKFQDVLEIANVGFLALEKNATEAQRVYHRELIKKDGKGLLLINNNMNSNIFDKIIEQETTKEAWDTLEKLYGGDEKLNKVNMQSLRKKYENLQMKYDETIIEFFSKMVGLINQIKSYGEKTPELRKVEKVLRDLPLKFDHIVVAIEKSKDLSEMKLEELQAYLEAHEIRLKQRDSEKVFEQALQAKFFKKMKENSSNNKKVKQKWKKKLNDNGDVGKASRSQGETIINGANQNQKVKKKVDMKEVQCYCCHKFCHYVRYCYYNKNNDEAKGMTQFSHDASSESEDVILMDAIHLDSEKENVC
ncbi:uncharacterized protein LOC127102394 [Lathyrus oleraceus]|uniref:uncharacterized protein LOC127102394 n=1 Tax=Pisum sativum TaxID=3888 RepID=UPI0021CFCAB5|nr:uncharacterized protein LOC127102394 [Pisum sativum]